ncbi:hypothetical protein MnTg02_01778 [bacterium MnTg02]|nr:hypothetical protein MnTg02_01778 [bacterium MnTg02]
MRWKGERLLPKEIMMDPHNFLWQVRLRGQRLMAREPTWRLNAIGHANDRWYYSK